MKNAKNSAIIDDIKERLKPVFKKYSIKQAMIFGSIARREETRRSDLDLIVVQDTQKPFIERYEGILRDIHRMIKGRDVDLLIYTPEEFDRMRRRRWLSGILTESEIIYESD